ncbi:MAG: LAGLIDADG family homing endonuclease [Candidatus Izemoplasmatales bacterium]|jgi:hypothetical protein
MNDTTKAYLAGFIDGEGCIRIVECKAKWSRGSINPRFREHLQVSNTNFEVMEWIRENFGGCITVKSEGIKKDGIYRKKQWKICWYDLQAVNLLKLMLPFLIVKNEEARVCIEFSEVKKQQGLSKDRHTKGRSGVVAFTDEEINLRRNFAKKLSELKKR